MIKKSMRLGQTLWVHCEGRTFTISTASASKHRKQNGTEVSHGFIESPMPGKVLKIEVEIGQVVEAHQTVCLIEAMKMEYSLKAPRKGLVKAIFKTAGAGSIGATAKACT